MMLFIGSTLFGFARLEGLSYGLHRWLFHGILWPIHKTHHHPHKQRIEWNDSFSVIFGSLSALWFLIPHLIPLSKTWAVACTGIGTGWTIYGVIYFVVHDVFTHRRYFRRWKTDSKWVHRLVKAHRDHHKDLSKPGAEPFGLFWVDPKKYKY